MGDLDDSAPELLGPAPLPESERIETLDVLRGAALLGILVINIRFFALPLLRWNDPILGWLDFNLPDLIAWAIGQVFFEHEMIALFSMLFGAGLLLMTERLEARGLAPAPIHYRRMFWLLVIGHAHAFLLWYGDILMAYAVCGALLFPLRRLRPWVLILLGVSALSMAPAIRAAPAIHSSLQSAPSSESVAEPSAAAQRARGVVTPIQQRWEELARHEPSARDGFVEMLAWRARVNVLWHYLGFHRFTGWLAGGFMLLGMGLLDSGVLTGARRGRFYAWLIALGYGVGLPVVILGVYPQAQRTLLHAGLTTTLSPLPQDLHYPLRYFGGASIALGHLGLIVLLYRARVARGLGRCLAAVGRMTLSSYLMQSLICVLLFERWALGLWGHLGHAALLGIVIGVWGVQLALCSAWLRWFRFGPIEWLWRSLTYGSRQPMRVAAPASEPQPTDAIL